MPNSDNAYGTFNKQTSIFSQIDDGSTALTVFADTDAAKSFFFTTEALAVWDETCTTLQWALVADGNGDNTKLKVTFDFGTKGGNIAEADDWAGQFKIRKASVGNPTRPTGIHYTMTTITDPDSAEHLF